MAIETEPPEIGRLRDTRILWRVSTWGVSAAIALVAVALTSQTDIGTERLAQVFAPAAAPQVAVVRTDIAPSVAARDAETKRLEEQVRTLAADRDRLAARIAGLEQNLNDMTGSIKDITGSIKRQMAAPPALEKAEPRVASAPVVAPPPVSAPPATIAAVPAPVAHDKSLVLSPLAMPAANDSAAPWPQLARAEAEPEPKAQSDSVTGTGDKVQTQVHGQIEVQPLAPVPMPPVRVALATPADSPENNSPRKPELGVDLGGARSMEVLNARWVAVKANFGPHLEGLRPLFVQDHRPGAVPYRLLVGPLPNGAAAAKLCSHFAAARVTCRTVKFIGNQLVQSRTSNAETPAARYSPPAQISTPR